ncbi:hypothetical protein [Chroococcus sp. FPU101]|nr:hypothetical protein [Chroococcus sp. FPU101]
MVIEKIIGLDEINESLHRIPLQLSLGKMYGARLLVQLPSP